MANARTRIVRLIESSCRRWARWYLGAVIIGVIGVACGHGLAQSSTASVDFQPLGEAAKQGASQRKVIAVLFTARWCAWCQKMYSSTFADPTVVDLSRRFVWASVDTDQQPEIAARFQVRSLPLMMWFNMHGELLDSQPGYMSPQAMEKKLRELADKADAPGQMRQRIATISEAMVKISRAESDSALVRGVREMVRQVAGPDRSIRSTAMRTLASKGDAALEALIGCLDDPSLSIRAAANELLVQLSEKTVGFDPFAPADMRAEKINAWRAWLQQRIQARPDVDDSVGRSPPARSGEPASQPPSKATEAAEDAGS